MNIPRQTADPITTAPTQARAGPTPPSINGSGRSRASFYFPKIGEEIQFKRTAAYPPEWGHVRSREFGTRFIEVTDVNAKPLRIGPVQQSDRRVD
jgi:hypothetical protein